MYAKQSVIIIVILLVAIILAVLVSFLVTTNTIIPLLPPYNNIITTIIFQEPSSNRIEDSTEDVKLISIYSTKILPIVRDYHDIISASINKIDDDNKMIFTMDLAGDANKKMKSMRQYIYG